MAGLRMCIVVSATSFLLGECQCCQLENFRWLNTPTGLLFTHWIADSLTLWKSPPTQTDARLWAAAAYYSILSRVPPSLLYVYGSVALLGASTLFWSLGDGKAGNFMFDGGSIREFFGVICLRGWGIDAKRLECIVLYSSAVIMYTFSVLPSKFPHCSLISDARLKTSPIGILTNFKPLPLPFIHKIGSQDLPPFPASLRTPTLELASSHLVCSVALTGVMVLQAGRWWAEQTDEDDEEEVEQTATQAQTVASESKKHS